MKTRLYLLTLAFCYPLLVNSAPVWAQGGGATAPAEMTENIGSTGWRIGSPLLSTGIYVNAPTNLTRGGVEWKGVNAFSSYSAQNDSVRVELVRESGKNYEALKKAAFERVGGNEGAAQKSKIAGYDALLLEKDGKIAVVVKYGDDAWAAVFLPQGAPDARKVAADGSYSLWFERREAPQWKDRTIGTTSFQADLPFELETRASDGDTVSTRVRWNDFTVDGVEWRAGGNNLDGTVKLHIDSLKNQAGIENFRVREVDREYGWGFLEKGERGKFVQMDYTDGGKKRRVYKIYSIAGTRMVSFQLTLNADDPQHLLAAHRILGTARLGWTDTEAFTPQKVVEEQFEFDSDSAFRQASADGLRTYTSGNPLAPLMVLTLKTPSAPTPADIRDLTQGVIHLGLKEMMKAAGGEVTKTRVEPLVGTPFPMQRVVFEAKIKDKWINGDAALIFYSDKVVMPVRLAQSSPTDYARRWASTFRAFPKIDGNWKKRQFGGIEVLAPEDATTSADGNELSGSGNGVKLVVITASQKYNGAPNFNPGPNETSPVTTGEIEAALSSRSGEIDGALQGIARKANVTNAEAHTQVVCAGNFYGMAGWYASGEAQYPRVDLVNLYDGARMVTVEIRWNPAQTSSAHTRDAILGSIWGS